MSSFGGIVVVKMQRCSVRIFFFISPNTKEQDTRLPALCTTVHMHLKARRGLLFEMKCEVRQMCQTGDTLLEKRSPTTPIISHHVQPWVSARQPHHSHGIEGRRFIYRMIFEVWHGVTLPVDLSFFSWTSPALTTVTSLTSSTLACKWNTVSLLKPRWASCCPSFGLLEQTLRSRSINGLQRTK